MYENFQRGRAEAGQLKDNERSWTSPKFWGLVPNDFGDFTKILKIFFFSVKSEKSLGKKKFFLVKSKIVRDPNSKFW